MNKPASIILAVLLLASSATAAAQVHVEDFTSAAGPVNNYLNPDGIHFANVTSSYIYSTSFNGWYGPQIAGRHMQGGCNNCAGSTYRLIVTFPIEQQRIRFGWGSQGFSTIRVRGLRESAEVWNVTQSGLSDAGLYKQTFNKVATAAEYFDTAVVEFENPTSAGRAALFDNLESEDAPNAQLSVEVLGSGSVLTSLGKYCYTDKTCTWQLPIGSEIGLTASAYAGWTFLGFGGDADCEDGQLTMSADRQCVAVFLDVIFADGFE